MSDNRQQDSVPDKPNRRRSRAALRLKPLIKGSLSFVVPQLRSSHGAPDLSTANAEFCYSLFLRHFSYISERFEGKAPRVVAELGPGSSIGVGLAALLAGAEIYYALDLQNHMDRERNLRILARLAEMFLNRESIPRDGDHKTTFPDALRWDFPPDLHPNLSNRRLCTIEHEIRDGGGKMIRMAIPWETTRLIPAESVDWLWSHSCLEHVDSPGEVLKCFRDWLRRGGMMTHEIDYRSHGLTKTWDGHWAVGNLSWKMVRGRRPYLINRFPHSFYVNRLHALGFRMEAEQLFEMTPSATPLDSARLTESDRHTALAFLACRKPG